MRWELPFDSRRSPVLAPRAAVATSQPLAAQAGLRALERGGTAVDAALSAAIALTVVQPNDNGLGSDAFALVWDGDGLVGFNGSGRSPKGWSRERFSGLSRMPELGWDSVTVPGAVDAWVQLHQRWGRLPFEALFDPALRYAREGFPVAPWSARGWEWAQNRFQDMAEFREAFLPGGRAPRAGELFRCPGQAESLAEIAATRGESFYRGRLAAAIADHAARCGGAMTREDLAGHQGFWVSPLETSFSGATVHELPPNGQGVAALIALGVLEHLDVTRYEEESPDSVHLQLEAMKVGFAWAHRFVADPEAMEGGGDRWLSREELVAIGRDIRLDRALEPARFLPGNPDTVYVTAADGDGRMVSYIQSNYMGFGSGIVVPGTGISLQNRGAGFVLEAGHANCVAGGKRPFHTIIPGFATVRGRPWLSFGVVGGHMQPQGHVQVLMRMRVAGHNAQAALDAPRWHVAPDGTIQLERGWPDNLAAVLRARGHRVESGCDHGVFGGGQILCRLENGALCGGSDFRKDGQVVGF